MSDLSIERVLLIVALAMLLLLAYAVFRLAAVQAEQTKILQSLVTQLAVIDARQQLQQHPNE